MPDLNSSHTVDRAAPVKRGRGNREGLTRQKVLTTGIQVIEDVGLPAFSLRKVAARCGVETMSLYNYVRGRDDLLDGIVELIVADLCADPEVCSTSGDWRDYLHRLAHGIRRMALAHPDLFTLIATRPPAAPWMRPPLRSLQLIESMLVTLCRNGFPTASSVLVYREFSSFLLGHLLLEVAGLAANIGPTEQDLRVSPNPADLSTYPLVRSLQAELTTERAAEEFDAALRSLLDRLQHVPCS